MSETVCFRCDWQGRARARTCPSCGAILYRPDRPDAARAPNAVDDDEARLGEAPTRRATPRDAAVAIAVVITLVAVVSVDVIVRDPPSARSVPRVEPVGAGALVYLAHHHGRTRLWVVDLLAGVARPGPTVPLGTAELVDVSGASSGWVGVERRTDRSKVAVSVLRSVAPDARAAGSDTATWSRGGPAARASCSPATDGRHRRDARRCASA